jgi:hypothetical protein
MGYPWPMARRRNPSGPSPYDLRLAKVLDDAVLAFSERVGAPGAAALHHAGPALAGWVLEAYRPVLEADLEWNVSRVFHRPVKDYYRSLEAFARSREGHKILKAKHYPTLKQAEMLARFAEHAAGILSRDPNAYVDLYTLQNMAASSVEIPARMLGAEARAEGIQDALTYHKRSVPRATGKLLPHPFDFDYDPEHVARFGEDTDPDARDDCFYKALIQRLKQMARDKDWDSIPSAVEFERDLKKCHLSAIDASRVRKVWTEIVDAMPARNPREGLAAGMIPPFDENLSEATAAQMIRRLHYLESAADWNTFPHWQELQRDIEKMQLAPDDAARVSAAWEQIVARVRHPSWKRILRK